MAKIKIPLIAFAILIQSCAGFLYANPAAGSHTPVAIVFSKKVFATDLEPDEKYKQKMKTELSKENYESLILNYSQERLRGVIWEALMQKFCQNKQCEPSQEEIDALTQFFEAARVKPRKDRIAKKEVLIKELESSNIDKEEKQRLTKELENLNRTLLLDSDLAKLKASLTQEQSLRAQEERSKMYARFIRVWKFSKLLHQQYGGDVILQKFGFEPIGAERKFLEECERDKTLQILDPMLRLKFWEYYQRDRSGFIVDDDVLRDLNLKHPFDKPFWLMKSYEPKE